MTTETETGWDVARVRALVALLTPCYCTPGFFVYGCEHTVRRLMARTAAMPDQPVLCHVCAEELKREKAEKAGSRCDGCGAWQAWWTK